MAETKNKTKKVLNPAMQMAIKSPEEEKGQAIDIQKKVESLTEMTNRLQARREEFNVTSRYKDMDYVESMDKFIKVTLDTIADVVKDEKALKTAINGMIEKGQFTSFKQLVLALGIIMERREELLGFDETRTLSNKDSLRKMKLQVMWKGADGAQGAVQVETR